MSRAFAYTFSRLIRERRRTAVAALVTGLAVLGLWLWWATGTRITLYAVTPDARLELDAATYPVQAPFVGKIIKTNLAIGQVVKQGDILAEIDAESGVLERRQEEVRAQSLEPELERLRSQLAAEEGARQAEQAATRVAQEEADNRIKEAEAAARYGEEDLKRVERLYKEGLIPERDHERAVAEVRRLRATVTTLESGARRVAQEQATRDRERDVRLERIRSEIARLEGQRGTLSASLRRLDYEIERRRVRAPVSGRIAETAILRAGAVVQEGEKLASIIPEGRLIIAAHFPASAAFGRIRPAQAARMRMQGFPWAEFGTVSATVSRVATEIRDQKVRVELQIRPDSHFRGQLEHGMPGDLEIEVERITPAALVVRTAGQMLTAPRS